MWNEIHVAFIGIFNPESLPIRDTIYYLGQIVIKNDFDDYLKLWNDIRIACIDMFSFEPSPRKCQNLLFRIVSLSEMRLVTIKPGI